METFKDFLAKELENKEFAQAFHEERRRLRIAYEIRQERQRRNLTQKQLAKLAGVTQQMISRIENADAPKVSLRTLVKVAAALDLEVGLVQPSHPAKKSTVKT